VRADVSGAADNENLHVQFIWLENEGGSLYVRGSHNGKSRASGETMSRSVV
jgi:hypothetical protein